MIRSCSRGHSSIGSIVGSSSNACTVSPACIAHIGECRNGDAANDWNQHQSHKDAAMNGDWKNIPVAHGRSGNDRDAMAGLDPQC
jgi:hypothetical protein